MFKKKMAKKRFQYTLPPLFWPNLSSPPQTRCGIWLTKGTSLSGNMAWERAWCAGKVVNIFPHTEDGEKSEEVVLELFSWSDFFWDVNCHDLVLKLT